MAFLFSMKWILKKKSEKNYCHHSAIFYNDNDVLNQIKVRQNILWRLPVPGAKTRLRKSKTRHITITVTVRQLGILVKY